jgi:hypothetical protein
MGTTTTATPALGDSISGDLKQILRSTGTLTCSGAC